MFGVIRGKKFNLNCNERREWMSHVCGLCLSLRAEHGQIARLTTNYDAALLSVLYEALIPNRAPTVTHYCPLRLGWRGEVVAANPGTQFAASIALMSAAVKIDDHVSDGDGWIGRLGGLFGRLSRGWSRAARCAAGRLGFDISAIEGQAERQSAIEAEPDREFLYYSRPTEEAVGSACGHVGVLAGAPERVGLLQRIGQLFGRIMYLVDAYRDYAADLAARKFNPLAVCYTAAEVRPRSWALFRDAHAEIRERFKALALPYPTLARRLLIDQLAEVGRQTMRSGGSLEPAVPAGPDPTTPASEATEEQQDEEAKDKKPRRRDRRPDKSQPSAPVACCGTGDPDCDNILCCYWLSSGFDCCDAANCGASGVECCACGQSADCCAAGAGGADCCTGADCCAGVDCAGGADCCAGAACS